MGRLAYGYINYALGFAAGALIWGSDGMWWIIPVGTACIMPWLRRVKT